MVKATEKPVPAPAPAEPLLVKSVVSFKVTVPLVQYGNIEMFASQEFYTQADEPDLKRDVLRSALLQTLREQMAEQVLPLVEAEVLRSKPQFAKDTSPAEWMYRNNPTYRWLRVAAPDLKIAAMQEVFDSRSQA